MAEDKRSLDVRDEDASKRSLLIMKDEIRLLDDIILHINHGTSALTGHTHDRGLNFLAGLLIHDALNSLWRAREDAVCGYPVQSLALCRAALEDWASLWWVERHPETTGRWLWAVLDEVEQPPERPPSFEAIWTEMGELGERTREAYDVLSKFAHPKGTGLRWLVHFDAQSTYFHVGGHFDERDLKACLYFLVLTAQSLFERVGQLQSRALGEVMPDWLKRGEEVSAEVEAFINKVAAEVIASDAAVGVADQPTAGSHEEDGTPRSGG